MNKTKIEWVRNDDGSPGYTWNPVTGCLHGCPYCYARRIAQRFHRSFAPEFHPDRLVEPLKLRKPSRIFVDSMGDLFDPNVPDEWRDQVFGAIYACNGPRRCDQFAMGHTFMVLTKQPENMRRYVAAEDTGDNVREWAQGFGWESREDIQAYAPPGSRIGEDPPWPPRNLWLGVTCENQAAANERIPLLLDTPAAVRFVSCEPLTGDIDFSTAAPCGDCGEADEDGVYNGCRGGEYCLDYNWWARAGIHWVIVGAMTGPSAVKPDPAWVDSIVRQCREAGTTPFLKDNLRWPERIQQWPEVRP